MSELARAPETAAELLYVPCAGPLPPVDEIGGKGHHLARLASLAAPHRFSVPPFVVLRVAAFARHAPPRAGGDDTAAWAADVLALECPDAIRDALLAAIAAMPRDTLLAARSSAVAEDAAGKSFAGQFTTVLGVRATIGDWTPLWDAVRRVWASAASAHAVAYGGGERGPGAAMAVVIQAMVDAEVAGVAFTLDPVNHRPDITLVSAVHGLGEGLVSGELDADTWRVSYKEHVARVQSETLAHKDRALRLDPSGSTRMEAVPEAMRDTPALSREELLDLVACANAIAAASDGPQDIEWALAGAERRLCILQTRPITTLGGVPVSEVEPKGERHVWDNSNIIESYGGVTTPLTFSFARAVYEDVYRQFCRLMGTSDALIASHQPVFANMLGLVRGRVYYDLLNWYRTLALLPGFTWNRKFMEKMMGVRESLVDAPPTPGTGSRFRDFSSLVRMLFRLVREARRLRVEVPAFHARLERALAPLASEDLERWPAERAIALYHRLEDQLLRHWRTPLVNDFFAMIFFGVLGRLTETWLPGAAPTLVNDLLCGEGGIVSTEPARRIMAMARRVSADPALCALFAAHPDDRGLLDALERDPVAAELRAELHGYVARFGDRCMEELKLETITLREDPTFLVHTLRAYVAGGTLDPEAAWARERAIRDAAERLAFSRLSWPRRGVYRAVLARARRRVRDRENLRFERTRVFGVVRRIFLALGAELTRDGRLEAPRDVFMLTREELFAAFEPGGGRTELRPLVRARQQEFAGYARTAPPPDRFESIGPPTGREWAGAASPDASVSGAELNGTGCCPGVVRARVRVVRDPREARDLAGRIMVAERTDPGWTVLFPAVAGLLIQRGSLLSHSAIVAREMGIPCVVGIAGLMATMRDGEEVEMDGTTGRVRRLEVPA
ncbi:MAG TPA: PEP/pyruvate-binding domain-containing protein [Candidatus Eisenbacteria bacterium]|jgi:pyruvate,water dikinase